MTTYDEDILDNPFYQALLAKHSQLYDVATNNGWMVCVPRLGSAARLALTRSDFENHLLVPASVEGSDNEEGGVHSFVTPNAKKLRIDGDVITTGLGYESTRSVRILFQETNYGSRDCKYIILCVDQPLEGELVEEMKVATLLSAEDCRKFLWSDSGHRLQKQIDKFLKLVESSLTIMDGDPLRSIVDAVRATITRAMQTVLKDNAVRKLSRQNQAYMENVKLAVATYVMEALHGKIFSASCALAAGDDATLNKMTRKLSDTRPEDLGLNADQCGSLPKARRELSLLNRHTTPLDKILCLRRVIFALTSPTAGQEGVTADDLLPLLIFLLIRSDIANWMGNMLYITHFTPNANNGEFVFVLSSFEAAIQHVKDDHVNSDELIKTTLTPEYLRQKSDSSQSQSPVDVFFELIRQNAYATVEKSLTAKLEVTNAVLEQMCHPLCACEKCEKLLCGGAEKGSSGDPMAVAANSRDDLGRTALHIASQYGHSQLVQLLLDCGAVANSTDYQSSTALHLACRRGHISVVSILVRVVDVNSPDNDGNTALHLTASNGHEEIVRALFSMRRDVDVNLANERGDVPLHFAARWGYESIVKLLLDRKAVPTSSNRQKETPRQCTHNQRIIALLDEETARLQADASFAMISDTSSVGESTAIDTHTVEEDRTQPVASDGQAESAPRQSPLSRRHSSSPASSASSRKTSGAGVASTDSKHDKKARASTVQLPATTGKGAGPDKGPLTGTLSQLGKEIDHLLKLCADGDVHMVRYKLGYGDVPEGGLSVVYHESELCHPLCDCPNCQTIRQRGSAPKLSGESCNRDGMTPLHVASLHGRRHVVQLLLRHGATVNCKNNAKQTPLHLACQYNHQDVVMLLVDYHAKVSPRDMNGRTPLHSCCSNGHDASAAILLFHGGDVNAADIRGNTPLHQACRWGHSTLALTLLLHGASPRARNASNLQPIQMTQDEDVRGILDRAVKGDIPIGSHRRRSSLSDHPPAEGAVHGSGKSSPATVAVSAKTIALQPPSASPRSRARSLLDKDAKLSDPVRQTMLEVTREPVTRTSVIPSKSVSATTASKGTATPGDERPRPASGADVSTIASEEQRVQEAAVGPVMETGTAAEAVSPDAVVTALSDSVDADSLAASSTQPSSATEGLDAGHEDVNEEEVISDVRAPIVTSSHDAVTSTQDAVTSTQDAVASTQDTVTSTQDAVTSTQEAVTSTQDSVASTQDSVSSTQDMVTSTQDAVTSTQDAVTSTQDAVTSSLDTVTSSLDEVKPSTLELPSPSDSLRSTTSATSSLNSLSPGSNRRRPPSLRRLEEFLTAIEDRSMESLHTLASLSSDVKTFNRRVSLRRSETDDRSGPSSASMHQFSITHFRTARLRRVVTRDHSQPYFDVDLATALAELANTQSAASTGAVSGGNSPMPPVDENPEGPGAVSGGNSPMPPVDENPEGPGAVSGGNSPMPPVDENREGPGAVSGGNSPMPPVDENPEGPGAVSGGNSPMPPVDENRDGPEEE